MKKNILYNRGGAELAIMFIGVVLAAFAAGLWALWWAKKTVLTGVKEGEDKFLIATKVAFFSTIVIYIGSIAGMFIAGAVDSTAAICDIFHVAQSGECPRSLHSINHIDYQQQYAGPLFVYFALPFLAKTWVSIALGLHADDLWTFISRQRFTAASPKDNGSIAPVVLVAAVCFLFFNSLLKSNSYFYGMCGAWNSVCFSNSDTFFFLFDYVLIIIGRLFDPWINLHYTLASCLGNQFKIDNLFPLIALIFGLRMWFEERRPLRW